MIIKRGNKKNQMWMKFTLIFISKKNIKKCINPIKIKFYSKENYDFLFLSNIIIY